MSPQTASRHSDSAATPDVAPRFDAPEALDALLERVWRKRFTTFLAVQGEVFRLCGADPVAQQFLSSAAAVVGGSTVDRRAVVNSPAFLCWLELTLTALNRQLTGIEPDPRPLRRRLRSCAPMLARLSAARNNRHPSFHRLDIDPVIAQCLVPSYTMPANTRALRTALSQGHPIGFFRDVVEVALGRIALTWNPARTRFDKLVHAIVYLPDAGFRSCSASRYTGIILLSSRDASLLDLEESLVHEASHQLLYHIVEDSPVFTAPGGSDAHDLTDEASGQEASPPAAAQYRLPWSGQMRDLYGYFHAFFVYVELARYHEQAMRRAGPDGQAAKARVRAIVTGLIEALPDFVGHAEFTTSGRALFEVLAADTRALAACHRSLLKR